MVLTKDEENFWILCQIVLNIFPKNLRAYFKRQWNAKFLQNPWQDSGSCGQFLISQIPQGNLSRCNYLRPTLKAGDSNKWDPTALFFVLTNAGMVNKTEKCEVERLRGIRNECFHSKSASITQPELSMKIKDIQIAFGVLNLKAGLTEITAILNAPIATQLSLQLQMQLDQERQLNDYYNKYLADKLNALEENVEGIFTYYSMF